jgi:hypothetical protein
VIGCGDNRHRHVRERIGVVQLLITRPHDPFLEIGRRSGFELGTVFSSGGASELAESIKITPATSFG